MKLVTIVGARPQFIKAAPVSQALRQHHKEILVHTGQHYDHGMSAIFFEQLGIPEPDYNLAVGSGGHGWQTGQMLMKLEAILLEIKPDWVLVYGDTNSTLAGALAAIKLHIPVAHVEAGLRSFNWEMPEEINRVLTDRCAKLLFCPTMTAVQNLHAENIKDGVHLVGDVMKDAILYFLPKINVVDLLEKYQLEPKRFVLATVHRASNTDSKVALQNILDCLAMTNMQTILPLHPRTKGAMARFELEFPANVTPILPVGYLDMLGLTQNAQLVMTDSGGVQKEAYILGSPCVTLRSETEWVETVEVGWNVIAGNNSTRVKHALQQFPPPSHRPNLFGDGKAAEKMIQILGG